MLEQAGRDPAVWGVKRPLNEIMNDEIPYERWERELERLTRAGYADWGDFLKQRALRRSQKSEP